MAKRTKAARETIGRLKAENEALRAKIAFVEKLNKALSSMNQAFASRNAELKLQLEELRIRQLRDAVRALGLLPATRSECLYLIAFEKWSEVDRLYGGQVERFMVRGVGSTHRRGDITTTEQFQTAIVLHDYDQAYAPELYRRAVDELVRGVVGKMLDTDEVGR